MHMISTGANMLNRYDAIFDECFLSSFATIRVLKAEAVRHYAVQANDGNHQYGTSLDDIL